MLGRHGGPSDGWSDGVRSGAGLARPTAGGSRPPLVPLCPGPGPPGRPEPPALGRWKPGGGPVATLRCVRPGMFTVRPSTDTPKTKSPPARASRRGGARGGAGGGGAVSPAHASSSPSSPAASSGRSNSSSSSPRGSSRSPLADPVESSTEPPSPSTDDDAESRRSTATLSTLSWHRSFTANTTFRSSAACGVPAHAQKNGARRKEV